MSCDSLDSSFRIFSMRSQQLSFSSRESSITEIIISEGSVKYAAIHYIKMTLKHIILGILLVLHVWAAFPTRVIRELNSKLDTVDPEFYALYRAVQKNLTNMSTAQINGFVCITGKMHLFGMQTRDNPHPDYLKAYFYIKMAAELFEQPECRYYLGIMYNFKLSPHFTIHGNIAAGKNKSSEDFYLQQLTGSMHLTHSELELYLASAMGHLSSMMVLANQNRMGISTKKNCTTAALYYMEMAKKIFVDDFLKHSFYRDRQNFEEQLYLKEKINTDSLIEDETYIVEETINIGLESYMANFEIAQNYYYGKNGFRRNYTKAASMFEKLQAVGNQESASLLGVCYFKGLGVTQDYKKAAELFTDSKKVDLSGFMLAMMEYYGIEIPENKPNAIKKLHKLAENSPQAKAFLGSLMIKGLVKDQGFKQGIILLEEASSMGNQHAKFILGLIYLDGTSFTYSCEKGVSYLMDSLIISDNCWDKIEQAKYALHENKASFALFRYLELSLIGDPVGMINGYYILSMFEESVNLGLEAWDIKRVNSDSLLNKLRKIDHNVPKDPQKFLLDEYTSFASIRKLRSLVKTTPSSNQQFKDYLKGKLLFLCQDLGESICKFISYKQKPDMAVLKQLANSPLGKLHVLQARYLLGKKHQEANKTQAAKTMYRFATGSWLMSEIIWHLEGGIIDFSIVDDFFVYASILIIMVGVAFVHRNMMLIKIHEKKLQEKTESDPNTMKEANDDETQKDKPKEEGSGLQEKNEQGQNKDTNQEGTGGSWLREKDD